MKPLQNPKWMAIALSQCLIAACMTVFNLPAISQTVYEVPQKSIQEDPLAESYIIKNGGGQEIAVLTSHSGDVVIDVFKYFKEMEIAPHDSLIHASRYISPHTFRPNGELDMTVDDFDGDFLSEIVAAWEGTDGTVQLCILKPDPTFLGAIDSLASWAKIRHLEKNNPLLFRSGGWQAPPDIQLSAGNFDADLQKEFALAYWADDGQGNGYVNITVYDVDDTLGVYEAASIMDQSMQLPSMVGLGDGQVHLFEIAAGDFNGDEIDEILLVGREPMDPVGWQIFLKIYSYDSVGVKLVPGAKEIAYSMPNTSYGVADVNATTGRISNVEYDQAVVSFFTYRPDAGYFTPDTTHYYLLPVSVNADLSTISTADLFLQQRLFTETSAIYDGFTTTLLCKDLNNDEKAEILSCVRNIRSKHPSFRLFSITDELQFSEFADLDSLDVTFWTDVATGDIDADTTDGMLLPELFYTSSLGAELYKIRITISGEFDDIDFEGSFAIPVDQSRRIEIADFDGDIRLGVPRQYRITEILQPLVVLNAPPIHFDILNGNIYDVCLSYNENDPQFIATYEKGTSQENELETEINTDWGISASLSSEHSFWGATVKSHLTTKYGEKFSKMAGSSTTVSVREAISANVDDEIYATVMDYNVWEYPVYGNQQQKGNVLVVEPLFAEKRWFSSTSWSGFSFIPDHEIGNIFSYREYPELENNPLLDEKIKGSYETSYELHETSKKDWSLQFEDFTTSGATTQKEYGVDWGASMEVWGFEFGIEGHYSKEEIATQRTKVASDLLIYVHLDRIDEGIGEVKYYVTPYAYWARNGALVIDYAAKPDLSLNPQTPTFWQDYYGDIADPAFILPWRYHEEKGFTLQTEAKRYQTKDIIFYPMDAEEGDVVTISTRVHNFSLMDTPHPIGVRFYVGDPDSGGTLIKGTGGEEEVYTDAAIPARGTKIVQLDWQIPSGLGTLPMIYAVIDEANTLPEINEGNNKGWTLLGKYFSTGIAEDELLQSPQEFYLYDNYPNPFNPLTTIQFTLPKASHVKLTILDILGREVATLISENLLVGRHKYEWIPTNLASGVYIYRLEAGDYVLSKKMLLLK